MEVIPGIEKHIRAQRLKLQHEGRVVQYDEVDAVYEATVAKQEAEARQMKAIEAGTNDRTWVDKALAAIGCQDLRA